MKVIALLAIAVLGSEVGVAQNLIAFDGSTNPPTFTEFSIPLNPAVFPASPALPAAVQTAAVFPVPFVLAPSPSAFFRDFAMDNNTGVMYATNGFEILELHHDYPTVAPAPVLGPTFIPGLGGAPLRAIAFDPLSAVPGAPTPGVLWALQSQSGTGTTTLLALDPNAGYATVAALNPAPVPGGATAPTGLDWVSTTSSLTSVYQVRLAACTVAGVVADFTVTLNMAVTPAALTLTSALPNIAPPVIPAGTAVGLALNRATLGVTGGIEYDVAFSSGVVVSTVPAGGGAFSFALPPNLSGTGPVYDDIAFHNYPQIVPGQCGCVPWGASSVGTSGPASCASSGLVLNTVAVTLQVASPALPVGTTCILALDFFANTVGIPPGPGSACLIWLAGSPFLTLFPVTTVASLGGGTEAVVNFGSVPCGTFVYAQWAIPCPGDPLGFVLSDAMQAPLGSL